MIPDFVMFLVSTLFLHFCWIHYSGSCITSPVNNLQLVFLYNGCCNSQHLQICNNHSCNLHYFVLILKHLWEKTWLLYAVLDWLSRCIFILRNRRYINAVQNNSRCSPLCCVKELFILIDILLLSSYHLLLQSYFHIECIGSGIVST